MLQGWWRLGREGADKTGNKKTFPSFNYPLDSLPSACGHEATYVHTAALEITLNSLSSLLLFCRPATMSLMHIFLCLSISLWGLLTIAWDSDLFSLGGETVQGRPDLWVRDVSCSVACRIHDRHRSETPLDPEWWFKVLVTVFGSAEHSNGTLEFSYYHWFNSHSSFSKLQSIFQI